MGLLILLVVGGVIGWIASMIMRTDAQQGIVLNIVVGIIGSFLAAFLLSPLLGVPPITSGAITASTLIISLLGAIVLLAIVNLVRRGTVR
ncbi:GlsB/YeaQ/YmgE family stress response membrane protein [Rhizorhabdus argentea]|uniref:GlsB/YeaQ/YmgE family stress response membrane protein n=1 Tax=Rhizorhabdus argentea TaxID=1387174 RepID=UPI0030EC846B